jgi:hypothetical protein
MNGPRRRPLSGIGMIGRGTVGSNSLVTASYQLMELTLRMFRAVFALTVESNSGSG